MFNLEPEPQTPLNAKLLIFCCVYTTAVLKGLLSLNVAYATFISLLLLLLL